MTIPYHLDSTQIPFNYLRTDGMTDVNTIISDVRQQLVTGLGWSEPSTALFKTPIDAAGRWMDVLLTRIAATNLEFRTRNAAGTTLCTRRIQIDNPGSVEYFCNIFGVTVNALRANPPERFEAHILDQSPDLQSDSALYVISHGYRNNADTADLADTGRYFAIDNAVATLAARARRWATTETPAVVNLQTPPGTYLFRDATVRINSAGVNRWAGRICHAIAVMQNIGLGVELQPFIDTSTPARFRVLGGVAGAVDHRWAFRKS